MSNGSQSQCGESYVAAGPDPHPPRPSKSRLGASGDRWRGLRMPWPDETSATLESSELPVAPAKTLNAAFDKAQRAGERDNDNRQGRMGCKTQSRPATPASVDDAFLERDDCVVDPYSESYLQYSVRYVYNHF